MHLTILALPVAAGPHGMTITPDGRWLYVSGDGSSTVCVIDTTTDRLTRTIDVGKSPHGVTLVPCKSVKWINNHGGPHAP